MLTCNRDFLKIYPSLKEKIDESSQMLQLEESMHFWNSFTQEEKLRDCQEIDIWRIPKLRQKSRQSTFLLQLKDQKKKQKR